MDKSLERKYIKTNTFNPNAKSIVIMDTRNNPEFPLADIIIDNAKYDSTVLLDEFRRVYGFSKMEIFLPWHFQVELIGRDYIIQNTRPVNYYSAFKDYKESICICIVGDSNKDIYMPDLYNKIANLCIKPFTKCRVNQVPEKIIYKTGKGFVTNQLEKLI